MRIIQTEYEATEVCVKNVNENIAAAREAIEKYDACFDELMLRWIGNAVVVDILLHKDLNKIMRELYRKNEDGAAMLLDTAMQREFIDDCHEGTMELAYLSDEG